MFDFNQFIRLNETNSTILKQKGIGLEKIELFIFVTLSKNNKSVW